jgi:hypothetical protein
MSYDVAVIGQTPDGGRGGWVYYRIEFEDGIENLETGRPAYHQQVGEKQGIGATPTGRVQGVWTGSGVCTVKALTSRPGTLPRWGPMVGARVLVNNNIVARAEMGESVAVNSEGEEVPVPISPPELPDVSLSDVGTAALVFGAAGAAAVTSDREFSQ